MNQAISAFSIKPDWHDAMRECGESIADQIDGSGLGILYLSGNHAEHASEIVAYLAAQTGIVDWAGTTGYAVCVDDREFHDGSAIVTMVLEMPSDHYRLLRGFAENPPAALDPHRDWIREHEARFALVHGDPRHPGIQQLITHLAQSLEHGFLVGGLSSSENAMVQVATDVGEGGLSGVLLSSAVDVATGLTQGCTPVSRRMRITMGEANAIHELDDRPALEVLMEILDDPPIDTLARKAANLLAALPIPGSDTGDYLVRNLTGIDTNSNSIWIADSISDGDEMMFCRRDTEAARADLLRMVRDVSERSEEPVAALYHTCLARGPHLFGRPGEELEIIQAELGDIPLVGFFCNGEICHDRLYAYTGVLTLIHNNSESR